MPQKDIPIFIPISPFEKTMVARIGFGGECFIGWFAYKENRAGQVFSYNPQQFLSGSLLRFILLPSALATHSSKPHPGSCHQDPGVDALCYIDQRIS